MSQAIDKGVDVSDVHTDAPMGSWSVGVGRDTIPLKQGKDKEGPFWKWGDSGKPYHYTEGDDASEKKAKQQAINQGLAIGGGKLEKASLEHYQAFHDAVMGDPRIPKSIKDDHKATAMGPAISAGKLAANKKPDEGTPEEEAAETPEEEAQEMADGEAVDVKEKKCAKGKCGDVQKTVPIIKADQQIVYGVVSEPDTIDLQGDRLSCAEIEKAAHNFMIKSQKIGNQHQGEAKASILESFIAPGNFNVNGQVVKKGSWVMAVKVFDDQLWRAVKNGEITGFSIGGKGQRTPF